MMFRLDPVAQHCCCLRKGPMVLDVQSPQTRRREDR
jgi:hypothetical protein